MPSDKMSVTLTLDPHSTEILRRQAYAIKLLKKLERDQPWNTDIKRARRQLMKSVLMMSLITTPTKE